jgi:hypothetical protein
MMILNIDQRQNKHPGIEKILKDHGAYRPAIAHGLSKFSGVMTNMYSRRGKNTLFFANGFRDRPGFSMPDYDPLFCKSWQEVTDERCTWLRQNHFDRPWVIAWSGGIDSTTILASVIKNLPKCDFKNITVACNRFGIWENPRFFLEFVQPNFDIMDSSSMIDLATLEANNYIFSGEPGDQLFAGAISMPMMTGNDISYLEKNIISDSDLLIDYVAKSPKNPSDDPPGREFAEWYYQTMINSIRDTGIPVETFHDMLWWSYFNFCWTDAKLRKLQLGNWYKFSNAVTYLDKFIHWFDSDDYQRWSMVHNSHGEKYGNTVGDYKLAAKRYIFDVDKNQYYLKYKTKTNSGNYQWEHRKKFYCITDDLSLLNLEDHWEIIEDLLPQYLASA